MKQKYIKPVCHSMLIDFESLLTKVSGNESNIDNYLHINFDPEKSGDSNASDNQNYGDYEN